jgi:hypothetical protein
MRLIPAESLFLGESVKDHIADMAVASLKQQQAEQRELDEKKRERDEFKVGTRPPEVFPRDRPSDWSDSRWKRYMDNWSKTHLWVYQTTKPFKKNSENLGWVDKVLWQKYQDTNPNHLPDWVLNLPPKPASKSIQLPQKGVTYKEALLRPLVRLQNPIIADGRPGGKKSAGGKSSRRLFSPNSLPQKIKSDEDKLMLLAMEEAKLHSGNSGKKPKPEPVMVSQPEVFPVAETTLVMGRKPRIRSTGDKCNIRHQELLGSINGASAFTKAFGLAINPGLVSTFPYLASQCANWERYQFRKLTFHYLTKTNYTKSGSVVLAADYDANEAAPSTEQIMFTYQGARETVPYRSVVIDLPVRRLHPAGPKLVRQGPVPTGSSVVDYDAATFWAFVLDEASPDSGALWGKLWVEYDVDFTISQSNPLGFANGSYYQLFGSVPTTAANFGTTTAEQKTADLVSISGNVVTSKVQGNLTFIHNTTATTSVTQGSLTASSGTTLSAITYSAGSGGTALLRTGQWSTVVGGTLTFANTIADGLLSSVTFIVAQKY